MAPTSLAPLDDSTAQAVEVLALAVERERVPGIVEFSTASDALVRAASSRCRSDLDYATVAFDSLDPGFRARIVERAYDLARIERLRLRMPQIPQPASPRHEQAAREEDLAQTLDEIIPFQLHRPDGPPKWCE